MCDKPAPPVVDPDPVVDPADSTVAVSSVTLSVTSMTIRAGESSTLQASIFPLNATDKTVLWQSDATDVATVSGGNVTAISEGTARITATCGGKSAVCKITVIAAPAPIDTTIIDPTPIDTTVVDPPVPPVDTTIVDPTPIDTTIVNPPTPIDTTVVNPPADTTIVKPEPRDTTNQNAGGKTTYNKDDYGKF